MRRSSPFGFHALRRIHHRTGFTVWELLAIIAVILGLLALMLPAACILPKTNGQRTQCLSNLRNIGIANLAFETRNKAFPAGLPNCKDTDLHQVEGSSTADCQGPNWQTAILADIEEGRMFQDILLCLDDPAIRNVCNDCPQVTQSQVGTSTPPVLRCPSDPIYNALFSKYHVPSVNLVPDIMLSKGSYAGCFGSESYLSSHADSTLAGAFEVFPITPPSNFMNKRWMLASNKGTRLSDIHDGSSKTILVGEILNVQSEVDARGVWTWPGMGGSIFTGYQTPNAGARDVLPICETDPSFYPDKNSSLICQAEQRTNTSRNPLVHAAARSAHLDCVNVILVDGSGHTVSDNIDPKVWRALCTRAGGPAEQNPGVPH